MPEQPFDHEIEPGALRRAAFIGVTVTAIDVVLMVGTYKLTDLFLETFWPNIDSDEAATNITWASSSLILLGSMAATIKVIKHLNQQPEEPELPEF